LNRISQTKKEKKKSKENVFTGALAVVAIAELNSSNCSEPLSWTNPHPAWSYLRLYIIMALLTGTLL
jgi:hypothetical protein